MIKVSTFRQISSLKNIKSFYQLCKPRVTALNRFLRAIIGMFLATPLMVPLDILFFASIGIAFVCGAAAAFNCLIEEKIDAIMARTRGRPLPTGQLNQQETIVFSALLAAIGLLILYNFGESFDHVVNISEPFLLMQ